MTTTLILVLASWLALSYLIYRYARFSPWRTEPIGRAFMMMKTSLWATLLYVLVARLMPRDWVDFRRGLMTFLLLYLLSAIVTQTVVIVRLQGGWRRRTDVDEHAGV